MAEPGKREYVPLTFFVREWDAWPDECSAMIADAPTGDDADDLCRIAAVVHALCDRDGVPVPAWVFDHRSEVDIAWGRHCVMEGFIWEQTIADAPANALRDRAVEQDRQRSREVTCLGTEVTWHEAASRTTSDAPVRSRTGQHAPVRQVPRG